MKNQEQNKYWFKRRRYGWGWVPVTWQGWTALLVFILALFIGALTVENTSPQEEARTAKYYLLLVGASVLALIAICYKNGPKPRWRWGKKDTDNPDEDF